MFISFVILALAVTLWTPTPVTAKNMEGPSSVKVGYDIAPVPPFRTASYALGAHVDLAPRAALVRVVIRNLTGGRLLLNLYGPSNYYYSIRTGSWYIYVRGGTYNYTVTARCGTASGRVKMTAGKIWTWYCN